MSEWIGNLNHTKTPFHHFWKHTVGSGHAPLTLRADWQQQIAQCHQDLGFKYVRFHGLLSDDMGTLICHDKKFLFSFHNINQTFDYLLSIGMKPFVELSFMPEALASGNDQVFHYKANVTPPKNIQDWNRLIQKLVSHWVNRYGLKEVSSWFFEVWNEPNLKSFWTASQEQYFEFYAETARTIKAVHPELRVGGPATAKNAWIPEFIQFCQKQKVPLDFISTHHYPTDAFGQEGDDTRKQLSLSPSSELRIEAQKACREAAPYDVYYTEWSTSSNPRDSLHDEPYAAAFIVKTIMEAQGLVKAYSYWTFSDIFEENYFPSMPFHGGFGLLNIHGIAKPAYRAYQLLAGLGTRQIKLEGSHPTVSAWALSDATDLSILAVNFALPDHPIQNEIASFSFTNVPSVGQAEVQWIDETHANAKAKWLKMGSPEYLTASQVKILLKASELKSEKQKIKFSQGRLSFRLKMPPQSVACVTLQKSRKSK